jgi:hypothetical protein
MANPASTRAALILVAALVLPSCDKEKPATEAPTGEEPAVSEEPLPGDDAGSEEPAEDAATSGEVDHEAMSHGDQAEGGEASPDEG